MIRSVRVLKNVLTNYLRFFLAGAIGFLVTPVMVHLLGDGDYGLWVTVFSLTGYFGLFDQGIRPSLVRYVSRDHALGDREGLARTVSSASSGVLQSRLRCPSTTRSIFPGNNSSITPAAAAFDK